MKSKDFYIDSFLELIRLASTDLPSDVENKIRIAYHQEEEGSIAKNCLNNILKNISIAREKSYPLCQDTGTNIYDLKIPFSIKHKDILLAIKEATLIATQKGYLRPNTVDSLTGQNINSNWGEGQPFFHIEQAESDILEATLLLKGGGCENVGAQYALPYAPLEASRDLQGIKKCILDAVNKAQGKGCSPGIIGVGIGGDRTSSYYLSKKQFLRTLDSVNPNPVLADLEEEMLNKANQLNIGPMGFGGKTTLLGAFIASQTRIPASFYVSISYMCWTFRRRTLTIVGDTSSYD